ncbi:hypothetical protein V8G69_04530 [Gaetbulibacter sp. M235]
MEANLNYTFKRKSDSYLDWLMNIIKSEKYYQAEGEIFSIEKQYY